MESSLYGIYALFFVAEISLFRCVNSFDFWQITIFCATSSNRCKKLFFLLLCIPQISRESIDAVKNYFREDLQKSDWQLMIELKKLFEIL